MNKFILPNLIFDVGIYKKRDNRFPLRSPFILYYDAVEDLIIQKINDKVRRALKIYYSLGGYTSTPLGEGEYAKKQGDDIFKVIKRSLLEEKKLILKMSFLEIGAGYGYLLYLLKKEGAKEILGLEPGKEGTIGSKKYKIPFVQDFFPSKLLIKKFDYIFSYAVLEHIENPLFILKEIFKNLNNDGMVFLAVPDCEKKMMIGDISIISHQHLNYFTENSLRKLMEKAGFKNIKIVESKKRSALFAWGIKEQSPKKISQSQKSHSDKLIFKKFTINFTININAIQSLIEIFEREGKEIGLYAPCANLIGLLNFKNRPRIFQRDKFKHSKYISGCPRVIEAPERLIKKPVDVLFIAPIDYDKEIRNYLEEIGLNEKKAKIISMKGIYENNSGIKYKVSSK
jgi:2-polyprenyl-3-methyl-5-hydroxy-6-metoxy-1,4-benzoquinol methylase